MSGHDLPSVSVCVCTYRRPRQLALLLESLAAQQYPRDLMEIIVVENEADGAGAAIVEAMQKVSPDLRIHFATEARQGISFARNKAVSLSTFPLLAFIDDDERADPVWLRTLVEALQASGADAAIGPVVPEFPAGSRDWIRESGLFDRPRRDSGTTIGPSMAITANALVRQAALAPRWPHVFDEAFALSGGEDYELFSWMHRQGRTLVWSDNAVVREEIPLARQKVEYILGRRFRAAVSYWRIEYRRLSRSRCIAKAVPGAFAAPCLCALGLLVCLPSRPAGLVLLTRAMTALGRVAALSRRHWIGYGPDASED